MIKSDTKTFKNNFFDKKSGCVRQRDKDGADGTGSQTVWKSKSMIGGVPNMYQYSIVSLRMECVSNDSTEPVVIWRNPAPNKPSLL